MEIKNYEDWMRSQVIDLFVLEYGVNGEEFDRLFGAFYEHPFQVTECVRIVAVEGERIAGFQSFFYWPLVRKGQKVRSLQSGNSLVHPEFRGQKLFARMLDFIHDPENKIAFDLLIGFPVEASYNSFIRKKWLNPFDLHWYVKIMTPFRSLFPGRQKRLERIEKMRQPEAFPPDPSITAIFHDTSFAGYRKNYQSGKYFKLGYSEGGRHAYFELKPGKRKKIIHELIIGNAVFSEIDEAWVKRSLGLLLKDIRRSGGFAIVSVAINSLNPLWPDVLRGLGFSRIDRKIHFIVKGPLAGEISDWSNWQVFRGDIDTW